MDLSPTFAVHFGNRLRLIYRGMEQLVARRAHNPKVASSSLAPATKKDTKELVSFFMPKIHLKDYNPNQEVYLNLNS
jgi:hypothetical protein